MRHMHIDTVIHVHPLLRFIKKIYRQQMN